MSELVRTCKEFTINNCKQWLYIHLNNPEKPSLLFLHGGPGWADSPWAHIICKNLWAHFNIIHWDQRGANRSNSPTLTPQDMSIDQLVSDGIEIVRLLGSEFGIKQPLIVGHSWGTLLGTLMARKEPRLFQGYIGIGQLVSNAESEPISLKFCLEKAKAGNRPELFSELTSMGDLFYRDLNLLFRQREILFELGGEFATETSLEKLISWTESAPSEYYGSWEQMYQTSSFSMKCLWAEVIQWDLAKEIQSLDLPVTLFAGRHDFCTSSSVAHRWYEKLKSKEKQFVWFEDSAHWPQIEENEKWSNFLISSLSKNHRVARK